MTGVTRESSWRVLWRSRWLVLLIIVGITGTTAAVSKLQPPVFVATATLVVNQPTGEGASFDLVQANQAYARTLARLIGSRNVAADVVRELGSDESPSQLLDRLAFAPVTETQLIEIKAESRDPDQAARLANTYATTFVDYVGSTIPNAAPSSGVSVADRAVLPASPDRPKPTLYTLVALLLSSALAVALPLLLARVDTRLHDSDALQAAFDIPVLGILPRTRRSETSHRMFEEAIRLVATSVAHAGQGPLRSIVVTSSLEGEGKSTVVAELGLALGALSLVDDAVLVVDADLRRPMLPARLGLPDDVGRARGLTTYMREEDALAAAAVPTALSSLRLLPAGPLPSHPSALLGFPESRAAVMKLTDEVEVVVLDTPPVSVGADASLVAMDADCVLLVVDLARTRLPDLRSAVDQLSKVGKRPLGFVVNRADLRDQISAYDKYNRKPSRRRRLRRDLTASSESPGESASSEVSASGERVLVTPDERV